MQQIETAIGEDYAAASAVFARCHLNQFILRNNFPHGRRNAHKIYERQFAKSVLFILSRGRP
jgi:hypothetical protein